MNRNRELKNPYKRLVLAQMLGESVVIYPLYSIMFGDRSHISAVGVGTLLAIWQIVQILAEVPTGVIADKFSKKYSILLGKLNPHRKFVFPGSNDLFAKHRNHFPVE